MAVRYGYADVPYGQVHYALHDTPQADEDHALVLLNSRSRSFLPFLDKFPRYRRVLSIDIPGFSRSTAVPGAPGMRDIAGGLAAALDHLGIERADVAGVHTGHKVATALASHWPARVGRLVVIGRSHSLVPDHAGRNAAMQAVVAGNQLDMSIIRMEGCYADDTTSQRDFARVFQANYEFDFAAALRRVSCPTLVVEITSDSEDALYGRQAAALTQGMERAQWMALPMTDPTGLMSYVGVETLVSCMMPFLDGAA